MSDVAALGNRITVALDRIRQGLAAQDRADAAQESLYDALQVERAQTAALRAQLDQPARDPAPQGADQAALNQRLAAQAAQLQALDAQLQQMRAALEDLQNANAQLRAGLTQGLPDDAHVAALMAEIAALHSLRSADRAELDAILAEFSPLVEQVSDAAS